MKLQITVLGGGDQTCFVAELCDEGIAGIGEPSLDARPSQRNPVQGHVTRDSLRAALAGEVIDIDLPESSDQLACLAVVHGVLVFFSERGQG